MKTLSIKNIFSYFFVSVFVLTSFIFLPLLGNKISPAGAFTSNPEPTDVAKVGEIWNGSTFDEANLTTLLKYVSNNDSISTSDLSSLTGDSRVTQTTGITAEDMRNSTAGKSSGQDIIVRLGGLDWTPTYLSKTKSDELILTLWLTNNEQDAWQEESVYSKQGDYYMFENGEETGKYGLYSMWSANFAVDDPSLTYPSDMYGTSYIRAATLNNGGEYTTNGSDLVSVEQDPNSPFAQFTMPDSPLVQYITTPFEVKWQEDENLFTISSTSGYANNDNWSSSKPNGRFLSSEELDYTLKDHYGAWSDDRLWLVGAAEYMVYPFTSRWGLSDYQRQNYDGDKSNSKVSTWQRSVMADSCARMIAIKSCGYSWNDYDITEYAAVRPALHLNLTKATLKETLATTVATKPGDEGYDDISQEPGENASEIIFHIKTAAGFLKLSEATENGWAFDPNWTFLLDNDINLAAVCDNFTPVGGKENLFQGTFDGQGHTIIYAQKGVERGGLFGDVDTCSIENLNVQADVEASTCAAGLICNAYDSNTFVESGVVNLTHVNITGSIVGTANGESFVAGVAGMFFDANLYDVNVFCDKIAGKQLVSGITTILLNDLTLNSCSIICSNLNTDGQMACVVAYMGVGNVNYDINNFLCDVKMCQGYIISYGSWGELKSFTCTQSQFNVEAGAAMFYGAGRVFSGNTTLMDVAINMKGIFVCMFSGDEGRRPSFYPDRSPYYYSGVYVYADSYQGVTPLTEGPLQVLSPDFTSSKWCQHDDLNSGLPMLRCFTWMGDYLNDFDMSSWASAHAAS